MLLLTPLAAFALDPAKVAEVAKNAEMPVDEVNALLTPLARDETVLTRMATPWEKKPWFQYRALFFTDERLSKGRAFRDAHADIFAAAEAKYQVPASVVLAILGVETQFGEKMGQDAIVTALFTLGFYHEKRGAFFRTELGNYLRLATDQGWDLHDRKGSYAGAMGMGQFMPSSYRKYAVDFDGDGAVDLFSSAPDAIGSIANYLAAHGWAPDQPILLEVAVDGKPGALLASGLDLNQTIGGLRAAGVVFGEDAASLDANTAARLFSFDTANGPEYRVALQNFWVITRYNRSTLYARAVTELAAAF